MLETYVTVTLTHVEGVPMCASMCVCVCACLCVVRALVHKQGVHYSLSALYTTMGCGINPTKPTTSYLNMRGREGRSSCLIYTHTHRDLGICVLLLKFVQRFVEHVSRWEVMSWKSKCIVCSCSVHYVIFMQSINNFKHK